MAHSFSSVMHTLAALIKYAVLLVAMVAAFRWWTSRSHCKLDSEDAAMRPALASKLHLVYDQYAWTEGDLERGDIVIVRAGSGDTKKHVPFRVVAVGGDWLEMKHGRCKVNDKNEQYEDAEITPTDRYSRAKFRIPRGHVFLLTDNRDSSKFGMPELVPVWRICGKVRS